MLDSEFIAAPQKSSRLMVVLHGLGDSTAGYEWMPEAMRLPWLNYLLVNAPDHYYGGYSWYDFTGDQASGILRSRKLLFELLDEQPRAGFPPGETVLFGFSQGCLMILDVGFRYPHRLAGLVGVSGYVHEPERLLKESSPFAREQRMLFTHGLLDPLVPCVAVREQVKGLVAAGLKIDWHEFNKAHTIAGEAELGLIRRFVEDGFAAPAR